MDPKIIDYFGPEILAIGTKLQVQLPEQPERFRSVLIGKFPGKFLIIKPPISPFVRSGNKLRPGDLMIIRYVREGAVFRFQTKLLGKILEPAEMMFISYPKTIEYNDLRAHPRYECYIPAEIVVDEEKYAGTLLDLSNSGCRFLIKLEEHPQMPQLKIKTELAVTFTFPESDELEFMYGRLSNIQHDSEETRLGIRFSGNPLIVQRKIAEYISTFPESELSDLEADFVEELIKKLEQTF